MSRSDDIIRTRLHRRPFLPGSESRRIGFHGVFRARAAIRLKKRLNRESLESRCLLWRRLEAYQAIELSRPMERQGKIADPDTALYAVLRFARAADKARHATTGQRQDAVSVLLHSRLINADFCTSLSSPSSKWPGEQILYLPGTDRRRTSRSEAARALNACVKGYAGSGPHHGALG